MVTQSAGSFNPHLGRVLFDRCGQPPAPTGPSPASAIPTGVSRSQDAPVTRVIAQITDCFGAVNASLPFAQFAQPKRNCPLCEAWPALQRCTRTGSFAAATRTELNENT